MSSPVLFCLTCARGKQTEPPGSERKKRPSFHSMCFSRCGAGAVGPFCLTWCWVSWHRDATHPESDCCGVPRLLLF